MAKHPRLVALDDEIDYLTRDRARVALELAVQKTGLSYLVLKLGDWTCEDSPTGACIYNHETDPTHDECLICSEPDDRR